MIKAIKDCVDYLDRKPLIGFIIFLIYSNFNLQSSVSEKDVKILKDQDDKLKLAIQARDAAQSEGKTKDKFIYFLCKDSLK